MYLTRVTTQYSIASDVQLMFQTLQGFASEYLSPDQRRSC